MATLDGPRAAPKSGETKSLVILLHGYGADGNDLFGLADPLSDYMPDTAFRSPNAPERSAMNPMGYQWFPIPWLDGSTDEQRDQGFAEAQDLLPTSSEGRAAAEGALIRWALGLPLGETGA